MIKKMTAGLPKMFCLFLIFVTTSSICSGHGDAPPIPSAPPVPARSKIIEVFPPRWSWVHWWEANRDDYLETIRQDMGRQKPDQKVIDGYRANAVEALLATMESPHWQARAAAALALGRMQEQDALDALKKLVRKDRTESARVVAIVAIGLLDSPEAQKFLLAHSSKTTADKDAAIVALGLLSKPNGKAVSALQQVMGGQPTAQATMAAWALRYSSDPRNSGYLTRVLTQTESPWLASEAIIALGRRGGVKGLADILLANPPAKQLPVWKSLRERKSRTQFLLKKLKKNQKGYEKAYKNYLKAYEEWQELTGRTSGPQTKRSPTKTQQFLVGLEQIYLSRLRASAAISLGNNRDPKATVALSKAIDERDDEFSDLYKGFALMSLGQRKEPKVVDILLKQAAPGRLGTFRKSRSKQKSPLRGYAVLALGLYARPKKTAQGPQLPPRYQQVRDFLVGRMTDRKDTEEVRSAAALALGLAGQSENIKAFQQFAGNIKRDKEIVRGYALLARGMLGDNNMIPVAKEFLAVKKDRRDTSGILARRAAVLGLGILGSQEGVPILVDAWDLNYYVNREAAIAFSLCKSYNVTDPLVELLNTSKKPLEQAFAARCLGELFASRRPRVLSRLITGSNYTVKNMRMIRFQALANEFLFTYLIPSFGRDWH